MRITVTKPNYYNNYAFDGGGNLLATSTGDVSGSWVVGNTNVKSVQFSKKENLDIGVGAFNGCGLEGSLVIPDNVASIQDSAFYGCASLTDGYINKPKSIWQGVEHLLGCSSMSDFYVHPDYFAEYDSSWTNQTQFIGTVSEWTSYPNLM